MILHVLGCSAAELPHANLTSFLIDERLLLDAGTIGTALDEEKQSGIRHVLITHAHLDHIKDLPFFADNISLHNTAQDVTVFSIPAVIDALKKNLFNDIVWPDFTKIPSSRKPILKLKTVDPRRPFRVGGYRITAYKVNHTVPAVGYLVEDTSRKKLFYMGDSGPHDTIWETLHHIKLNALIIEVSLPNRLTDRAIHTGHLTPRLLVSEINKMHVAPDRILITHCKPAYRKKVEEELGKLHLKNIEILKDGDVFAL